MSAAAVEPGGTSRGMTGQPAPLVAWIDRPWGPVSRTHGGHLAALGLAVMRARLVGEFGQDRPVRALVPHFLEPVADRPLTRHAVVERVGRDTAVCSLHLVPSRAARWYRWLGDLRCAALRPDHNGSCTPTVPGADDCPPLALPRRRALRVFDRPVEPAEIIAEFLIER